MFARLAWLALALTLAASGAVTKIYLVERADIPGYRSVIQHQVNGLLVPPKDHEQLAWAICHVLGDHAERAQLERAARQRAEAYSWAHVGGEVEAYYEELLAQRRPLWQKSRQPVVKPGAVPG